MPLLARARFIVRAATPRFFSAARSALFYWGRGEEGRESDAGDWSGSRLHRIGLMGDSAVGVVSSGGSLALSGEAGTRFATLLRPRKPATSPSGALWDEVSVGLSRVWKRRELETRWPVQSRLKFAGTLGFPSGTKGEGFRGE